MTEPVYLVTGATDGIGKATALALAKTGATVILHGRSETKLAAAVRDAAACDAELHWVRSDFASLADVARMGDEIAAKFPGLNVLINNAGHLTDHRQLSVDGFELTFAVNYLAPWLLTHRLLDTLRANAPARIVNVASTAMGGGYVDFGDLQLARTFDGWQAYANSKLMNVLFSSALAARLAGSNVVSNALCPGLIDTNFFHTNTLFADRYDAMRGHMRTPEEGALVPLYLATDPAAGLANGEFFVREGRDGRRAVALNRDRDLEARLWAETERLLAAWL